MSEFQEVIKKQKRMCRHYEELSGSCTGCPLHDHEVAYVCTEAPCVIDIEDVKKAEKIITEWAEKHPEPVYPTWAEWLLEVGGGVEKLFEAGGYRGNTYVSDLETVVVAHNTQIPADTAHMLGVKPKKV